MNASIGPREPAANRRTSSTGITAIAARRTQTRLAIMITHDRDQSAIGAVAPEVDRALLGADGKPPAELLLGAAAEQLAEQQQRARGQDHKRQP